MKKYFIVENNQQSGPLSIDELRNKGVTPSTLVWFDGMANWEQASAIGELNGLFMATPPPPPPFYSQPAPAPSASNYAPIGGNGQSTFSANQPNPYHRKPDAGETGGGLIAIAYILALLGGVGGIIAGAMLWMGKVRMNGDKMKKYTPTGQLHGAFAFFLGIIIWAICVEMFLKS